MRRLALAVLTLLLAPAIAGAATLTVPIDQTRKIPFSGLARTVVPGNPAIADVNIVGSRTVLVTGKRQGVTNVVVFDADDRILFDGEILVSAGDSSVVSVTRGTATTTYACAPTCQKIGGQEPPEPPANGALAPPAAAGTTP